MFIHSFEPEINKEYQTVCHFTVFKKQRAEGESENAPEDPSLRVVTANLFTLSPEADINTAQGLALI